MVLKLGKIIFLVAFVYGQHGLLIASRGDKYDSLWNQQKTVTGKVFMVSNSDGHRIKFRLTQTFPNGRLKEHLLEFCDIPQHTSLDDELLLRNLRVKTLQGAMTRRSDVRVSFPDTFKRNCVDTIDSTAKLVNI